MEVSTQSTDVNANPKQANTGKKAPVKKNSSPKKTVASDEQKIIHGISQDVINTLNDEINLMLTFASNNGLIINTEVNTLIQSDSINDLINAHNLLCKNVAPATPKSIGYTNHIRSIDRSKSVFKQIPLVRNLVILALLFLVAYVSFGQTKDVNNSSLDKGVLNNDGLSLLLNLGFLSSIAGLGVLFHLLKKVSGDVLNSTLVPEETINYVSQILLGIMSGLIISEMIVFYSNNPNDINLFNKSLLALIGGFSADAIFSVLEGLILRLKNIFVPTDK